MPCGQQIAIMIVVWLVALSVGLPTDAKNQLWGYITELGGAIWLINKITKS